MSTHHARLFKRFGAKHYGFNKQEIVIVGGKGIFVRDTEGNVYYDLVAGYASNGFGHCHPCLHQAMIDALFVGPDGWGIPGTIPNAIPTTKQTGFLEKICVLTGYQKVLPMNTGAEAVETSIKLARKWGYTVKGVPRGRAVIVACDGNFHGRTTTIVGFSGEDSYREPFVPGTPGFVRVPFGDCRALEKEFRSDPNIVAFLVEPIQGEGGVRIPPHGYLRKVRELCTKYNILMIADEIQTGLGRTGEILASSHDGVRPDVVLLAKLLGAGKVPVSCVLADEQHMVFAPGEHGSTYAGNAFSMAVAGTALQILIDEKLCERSQGRGKFLLKGLRTELARHVGSMIKEIRGRGLMLGIELMPGISSGDVIDEFFKHELLAKDAHGVIRISPPLIITENECTEIVLRISRAFDTLSKKP